MIHVVLLDKRRSGRGKRSNAALQKTTNEESENEDVEVEKEDGKPVEVTSTTSSEDLSPAKTPSKRGRKAKATTNTSQKNDSTTTNNTTVDDSGSEIEAKSEVASTRSTSRTGTKPPPKSSALKGKLTTPLGGRGRRAATSTTTSNDDDDDPYAFKEPENLIEASSNVVTATVSKSEGKTGRNKAKPEEKVISNKDEAKKSAKTESDSTESDSETEVKNKKPHQRPQRAKKSLSLTTSEEEESKVTSEDEDQPLASPLKESIGREVETCVKSSSETQPQQQPPSSETVNKPPVMQFTMKKQQELFPHLSGLKASSTSEVTSEAKSSSEVKTEIKPETKSDQLDHEPSSLSAKKQRKMPNKPKSSELIDSGSSSDSGTELEQPITNIKPDNKRRPKRKLEEADEDEPLSSRSTSARRSSPSVASKKLKTATKSTTASNVTAAQDEQDDFNLECGETIPGSPVHSSSTPASASTTSPGENTNNVTVSSKIGLNTKTQSPASNSVQNRLEMPFASVPESVQGPPVTTAASDIPATLPPTSSETPDTASTPSRSSPPATLPVPPDERCKSPEADSSEVDMESLKAESLDIEGSSSGEARGQSKVSGVKRKPPVDNAGNRSPAGRRKRTRARVSNRGGRGGKSQMLSDRNLNEDTDESEEAKDNTISAIGSLDNDALAALAQRSPRSSKYNFFPDFGKSCFSPTLLCSR